MQLVRDRDYWVCSFCPSFVFPSATADGVRFLGEGSERDCPVCGANLQPAAMEGRQLLACGRCHGVLVDLPRFTGIVQTLRALHKGDRLPPVRISELELARSIACPSCKHPMETHPYYGPGNVVLDSCGHCGLIWCDRGEIATLGRS